MRLNFLSLGLGGIVFVFTALFQPCRAALWGNETITTVPGTGRPGTSCGAGSTAGWPDRNTLATPSGITLDAAGNIYVGDFHFPNASRIWKITPGTAPVLLPPPQLPLFLRTVRSMVVDAQGRLVIADSHAHRVLRTVPGSGLFSVIAGTGVPGFDGTILPPAQTPLNLPYALALASDGSLFIAETGNYRVRKLSADGMSLSTVAGTGQAPAADLVDGAAATQFALDPRGLALDGRGNLYILDVQKQRIYKMLPDGTLRTWVGGGTSDADDIPGNQARLLVGISAVHGMVSDSAGNLYFRQDGAQNSGSLVRKADPSGRVYTVAGQGLGSGCLGDGGPALNARIGLSDGGLALDSTSGSLYVAEDEVDGRLRKIDPAGLAPAPLRFEKRASVNSVTLGGWVNFSVTASLPAAASPTHELVLRDTVAATASYTPGNWDGCSAPVLPGQAMKQVACVHRRLLAGNTLTMTVGMRAADVGELCNTAQLTGREASGGATACVPVLAPRRLEEFVLLALDSLNLGASVAIYRGLAGVNRATSTFAVTARLPLALAADPGMLEFSGQRVGIPMLGFATGGAGLIGSTVNFTNSAGQSLPAPVHANWVRTETPPDTMGLPTGSFPLVQLDALPALAPAGNFADVNVRAGEVRALAPGRYRNVIVEPGGTLRLVGYRPSLVRPGQATDGGYEFQNLILKPATHAGPAVLRFRSPPENRGDLRLGNTVTIRGGMAAMAGSLIRFEGGTAQGLFRFDIHGQDAAIAFAAGAGSFINASVHAPGGRMTFANGAQAFGRFVGKTIEAATKAEFGLD